MKKLKPRLHKKSNMPKDIAFMKEQIAYQPNIARLFFYCNFTLPSEQLRQAYILQSTFYAHNMINDLC